MTNLSQQKRERMLAFLSKLKELHGDDESLHILNQIETEINEKRYGLIWEEHSEHVDQMLVDNIPVFVDVPEKTIVANEQDKFNFLLEGDNLHSLILLQKTHFSRVDLIYIDPPYNTGNNQDFMYNDTFTNVNDVYRHSKWLSFMNIRLKLARELLKDDGVIFISIDQNEYSQLKLLCDSIFGESNYVNEIVWQKLTASKTQSLNFPNVHEKILVYRKSASLNLNKLFYQSASDSKTYNKLEAETGRLYGTFDFTQKGQGEGKYFGDKFLIPPKGKHWIWSQEKINEGIAQGLIVFTKNGLPRVKRYLDNKQGNPVSDLWIDEEIKPLAANSSERVGFTTQKPLCLINRILKTKGKESVVLDFFAGSGTTGHAVQQLNKEDGGNRTYILCTNNENNICEEITYKRLAKIQDELPHNLRYFRTDFVPKYSEEQRSITSQTIKYVRELIELEHQVRIDGLNNVLILRSNTLYEQLDDAYVEANVYVSSWIYMDEEEERLIEEKSLNIIYVPDYYFQAELTEVGEL